MVLPAFDPWLSHLRRDRRGLAVPYVNLWGEETPDRIHVAHDPNVGQRAAFLDDADAEVPDFTRQNMGRQRRCMALGLCQVCERPVPWSRRNVVISGVSVEWVPVAGQIRPVIFEPWLDDRCAEIATRWCPALIRRHHGDDLTVLPVRQGDVQLVVSTGWVEGQPDTRTDMVAMWVKVALLRHNIVRGEVSPTLSAQAEALPKGT